MEKQKIYEKLITIIGEVSEISDEKVTLESTFENLGIDLIDCAVIMLEIESIFNISIPDYDKLITKKIELIVNYIEANYNNKL